MFSKSTPEPDEEKTQTPKNEKDEDSDTDSLEAIFRSIQSTSEAVNRVASASAAADNREKTVFEQLKLLTEMPQQPERKRMRPSGIRLDHTLKTDPWYPSTPEKGHISFWSNPQPPAVPASMFFAPDKPMPELKLALPPISNWPLTDDDLVRMKGPSRLINFLVHLAMDERARRALRWTGNGLEFILVNKELVARMWGNRKHNTKNMDYYKLSRAIREKYDKKNEDGVTKPGKLKKGSRTYSYVFTEYAYQDLETQVGRKIPYIQEYAQQVGIQFRDNNDLNSNSPQAGSPQNREE